MWCAPDLMWSALGLLALTAASIAASAPAAACDCAQRYRASQLVNRSLPLELAADPDMAIFFGRVEAVDNRTGDARISLVRAVQGRVPSTITAPGLTAGSCGVFLEPNTTALLVMWRNGQGGWASRICEHPVQDVTSQDVDRKLF